MFFRSRVAAEAAALMTYWRILRTRRPRSLPLSPLSSPSSSSSRTLSSHSEFIMEKERGQWSAFVAKNSFSSSAARTRELNAEIEEEEEKHAHQWMTNNDLKLELQQMFNHHRYNNNNIKNAASTKSEPTTGAQNYTTTKTTKQKKNEKKCVVGNVPEYICRSSSFSSGVATKKECDDATKTLVVAGRNEKTRSESDLLGELDTIPKSALYGIATQRAVDNYPITGVKLSHFPEFIRALAFVKKAAATANFKVGLISKEIFEAISIACDSLLDSNEHHGDFIVDVIQGGAGTSTNMAANEIIANLANLSLNKPIGSYEIVHPNDHVNLCQSTNDAYPTAAKLAVGLHHEKMVCELKLLIQSFRKKGDEFKYIVKMGRTQLQDAVPMTLGQEFNSFANSLESDLAYLMKNVNALYECNLGGTAIGTSITAHKEFSKESIDALKELTKLPFTSAKDFVEASSSTSSFLLFSSILRRIALKTSKICNDLRLLSSGPRCGFNEIDLPAVAPGSSIMPGKINPVIPEVMNQVCFQVIGADAAISMASEHAQLQLNAFEPLIVYNLLNSLDSMTNGLKVLREKCIDGITANEDVCASHVNNSIGIVTALLPKIGYKKATLVAKTALETNKPVSQVATEVLNFLSQDEADTLLNIENMTGVVAGDKNAEAKRNSYPKRGVDIESPQSAGGDKCNFWSYMYPPERQLFQSAGAM